MKTREVFEYLKKCAKKMRTVHHGEIAKAVDLAPVGLAYQQMSASNSLCAGAPLQLGDRTYTIVGIDSYELDSHVGREVCWDSYTVVADQERLGYTRVHGRAILWFPVQSFAELDASKMTLEHEKSGIARISFQGDRGPSMPVAELLWFSYDHPEYQFAAIERFLEIRDNQVDTVTTCFYVGKVIRPDA